MEAGKVTIMERVLDNKTCLSAIMCTYYWTKRCDKSSKLGGKIRNISMITNRKIIAKKFHNPLHSDLI